MEVYLIENYYDEIVILLNDSNDKAYGSLQVDLIHLQQNNFEWFQALINDVHNVLPKWNAALFLAQRMIASKDEGFLEIGYQIKANCYVRFVHFPPLDSRFKLPFPNNDQIGQFREVKGTVVRMTQTKVLEMKRDFICSKCQNIITVNADYCLMFQFEVPKSCTRINCKGNVHQKDDRPPPQYCVQYQELRIQEALSDKNIPPTITVTLDSDLVDSCQPGDCVTICGTIERRWTSFNTDKICEAIITVRAVSVVREQNSLAMDAISLAEKMMSLKGDWLDQLQKYGELGIRDIILKSICPDVYGMYPVKLAIALAICSGNAISDIKSNDLDDLHHRGQSHVLLVGDPGLAKSKLLLSAVQIAPRAVHTTGMGCSSAGLTAAAVQEEGEWVLEAGALVLADGGICCIDEFNMMRESDRASIHEAMEQQTISLAKAGIVCKLSTRCAIIAAANPKNLSAMSEADGTSSINIGIAAPLLSRFDLVFILRDERLPEWDDAIADHLLAQVTTGFTGFSVETNNELWSSQKLQTHFDAVSQVRPQMTPIASEIISNYYKKCRQDPERDQSRTTIRLLDSLNRLAEAHARLLFRNEITAIDAVITIRLMESTFGFGRIVKPYDVIKEELPLGPDPDQTHHILKIFDMDSRELLQNKSDTKVTKTNQVPINQNASQKQSPEVLAEKFPTQIPKNEERVIEKSATQPTTKVETKNKDILFRPKLILSKNNRITKVQPEAKMDLDEIDDILSLDTDNKKEPTNIQPSQSPPPPPSQSQPPPTKTLEEIDKNDKEDSMSEDGDLACSQALDSIEEILSLTGEPEPKIPKIDAQPPLNRSIKPPMHRLTLKPLSLKRFPLVAPKKPPTTTDPPPSNSSSNSNEEKPIEPSNSIEIVDKPKRNRIFCTPSDEESSQNTQTQEKPVKKNPFKLNLSKSKLISPRPILQQQNVNESKDSDKSENDSAYDTMEFSSGSSGSPFASSAAQTGKTPAIFPPSKGTVRKINIADQDLSCLDF